MCQQHTGFQQQITQSLKVSTFIYRHLHSTTSSSLQFEVAYWPAMTLDGAAQVAAAHCPNERTLGTPQSAAITDPPMPQPALRPSPRSVLRQWLTIFIFVCETNFYSFTIGMESWVSLITMSVNNLLKVITRKRSWWDSNPWPMSH